MSLRYLVDTDWTIHYMNGHPEIVQRLDELQPDGIGISMVSLGELWEGVYYSRDPADSEQVLREFLRTVSLVPITALTRGLTLLTNNRRHFEMIEGLRLVS